MFAMLALESVKTVCVLRAARRWMVKGLRRGTMCRRPCLNTPSVQRRFFTPDCEIWRRTDRRRAAIWVRFGACVRLAREAETARSSALCCSLCSAGNVESGELCVNQNDVVDGRPEEFAPPPPQNAPAYTSPPAAQQQQQPQQADVPVTIDVVKQLTVDYPARKENSIH